MSHEEYREAMLSNSIRPVITRFAALHALYVCVYMQHHLLAKYYYITNSLCQYVCIWIIEKTTYRLLNVDETVSKGNESPVSSKCSIHITQ